MFTSLVPCLLFIVLNLSIQILVRFCSPRIQNHFDFNNHLCELRYFLVDVAKSSIPSILLSTLCMMTQGRARPYTWEKTTAILSFRVILQISMAKIRTSGMRLPRQIALATVLNNIFCFILANVVPLVNCSITNHHCLIGSHSKN